MIKERVRSDLNIHRVYSAICIISAASWLMGCAAVSHGEKQSEIKRRFSGTASYYSDKFQNKQTASGELYDRLKYTAAHRTLAFGSKIRIVNTKNKRSVVVKVNDRGPQRMDRVLDVSYAAAKDLDMLAAGIIEVDAEVLGQE